MTNSSVSFLPIAPAQVAGAPLPKALFNEAEAAEYLGFDQDTLRVWRSKSRRAKRLIGPRWTEIGGTGTRKRIRYRLEDLQEYTAAGAAAFKVSKPRGRPRKAHGATDNRR